MEGSLINYSIWLVWITMWTIDSAAIAVIRVHYRITIPITILLLSLIVIPQTSPYQKKFCTSLMVKVKNPYCTSSCTACYIQGSANTIRKAKNFVLSSVFFHHDVFSTTSACLSILLLSTMLTAFTQCSSFPIMISFMKQINN